MFLNENIILCECPLCIIWHKFSFLTPYFREEFSTKARKTDFGDRDLKQYLVTLASLMEQKQGKNQVKRIHCCQKDLLLTRREDDNNNKVSWFFQHCKKNRKLEGVFPLEKCFKKDDEFAVSV